MKCTSLTEKVNSRNDTPFEWLEINEKRRQKEEISIIN
ncbi:hypothetical protein SAMN05216565_10348 [Litchfieldia salsa]|uniref:Uncharacterized protein n=1 Tax=Litchfieldia salsa TaxID=930152 RepID=A0A1H0SPA2_9BACI|nr:hypothetical protein SAMN05216565_10348 [Litchfieldia salsa]